MWLQEIRSGHHAPPLRGLTKSSLNMIQRTVEFGDIVARRGTALEPEQPLLDNGQMQMQRTQTEQFAELHARHRAELLRYVRILVPNTEDAEEVLQEACVVSWNKFDEFEPGTNFVAWARRIAYFEILKFRRRRRDTLLQLSDEVLDTLADETDSASDELTDQCEKLVTCIERLTPRDREVIRMRYSDGRSAQGVAEVLKRPVDGIFKTLRRIRQQLMRCVTRISAEEDHHDLG